MIGGGIGYFAYDESQKPDVNLMEIPIPMVLESHPEISEFQAQSNLEYDISWQLIEIDSSYSFQSFNSTYCDDSLSIPCFRGNHQRNSPSKGFVAKTPTKLVVDWIFKTRRDTSNTRFGRWGGGTGWTGQPLLIHWSKEMKEKLKISDPSFVNNENALEVIIGSLSGEVYFLNFENGDTTRTSIQLDGPIKGTPSVDPRLNGLLYVGQGIDVGKRFGSYIIDMTKQEIVYHQPGKDSDSKRKWGAFDSNPLIDKNSGHVFWPAENGIFYTFNSKDQNQPKLTSKLKYKRNVMPRIGMESSMAALDNYGFIADNCGNVFCIDLKHRILVWNHNNKDDTDATIVLDKEGDEYYLYVGNEVDHRGPTAISSLSKLNAKTGEEIWHVDRECHGTKIADKTNSGGILATPLIGKKSGDGLVYCIYSRTDKNNRSQLVAIEKESGKEVFSFTLKAYSWASPIDFYDSEGNIYLFFTDVKGSIYLLDGKTGELIYTENLKYTFESSPIMIGNRIIVGVRGNKILSFLVE